MSRSKKWYPFGIMDDDSTRSEKKIVAEGISQTRCAGQRGGVKHIRLRYEFRGFWQETIWYDGVEYCKLEIDGGGHLQEPKAPSMPQEGLYVNLPSGAKYLGLEIDSSDEEMIELERKILPNPLPALENEELVYQSDNRIYGSDQWFPEQPVAFAGVHGVEGYQVIHLVISPLMYSPVANKLRVTNSLTLTVSYEIGAETDALASLGNIKYGDHKIEILGLSEQNPMDRVDSCGYEYVQDLKDSENAADLLIITTGRLKESFQDYLLEKSKNYKVVIIELDRVCEEFPHDKGKDYSIHDFLCYAAKQWLVSPRYIVLGGNIRDVPTHKESFLGASILSDHFYADLSGDICPDIVVSRFPASEPDEMERLCKFLTCYTGCEKTWGRKVLLTTFNREDYHSCIEDVAEMIHSEFQVCKCYDGEATKKNIVTTINDGVGFINYRGHGIPTGWQAGNGLKSDDLKELNNDNKIPQVLSIACSNNALDNATCFGCEWIRKGKAVSFLGASVPSYTVINHEFDKCLWEGIMLKGLRRAGDIFNYGINKLYVNHPDSELVVHTIYAYLLVGDPTADLGE